MVEWIKIVGLGVVAAIGYGIAHDSVTTRVCLEYFTVAHPPIFGGLRTPNALALGWGVLATWWVGLALGVLLAATSRLGPGPTVAARDLLRPVGILLATMAVLSAGAGLGGYYCAGRGWISLAGPLGEVIPPARHAVFLADLWAHLMAYGSAALGGLLLAVYVTLRRDRLARAGRPAEPSAA